MNKIDQLFIRACKSLEPSVRIESVYRRFYAVKPHPTYICGVLANVCSKYLKIDLVEIIDSLNPLDIWKYGGSLESSYHENVVKVLISKIRLTKVSVFPGLSTPRMFREDKP